MSEFSSRPCWISSVAGGRVGGDDRAGLRRAGGAGDRQRHRCRDRRGNGGSGYRGGRRGHLHRRGHQQRGRGRRAVRCDLPARRPAAPRGQLHRHRPRSSPTRCGISRSTSVSSRSTSPASSAACGHEIRHYRRGQGGSGTIGRPVVKLRRIAGRGDQAVIYCRQQACGDGFHPLGRRPVRPLRGAHQRDLRAKGQRAPRMIASNIDMPEQRGG